MYKDSNNNNNNNNNIFGTSIIIKLYMYIVNFVYIITIIHFTI